MDNGETPDIKASQVTDMASDLQDMGDGFKMSKELTALLQRGIHAAKLPRALRTQKAAESIQTVFEIIGGVPRLAMWADEHPKDFYTLFARMIPQTIAPVVADLPKEQHKAEEWPAWLTARRLAYQESDQVAEDVKIKGADEPLKLTPRKEIEK